MLCGILERIDPTHCVRHNENIERALSEIAELRRDMREESTIVRARYDANHEVASDRWRQHETRHAEARKQIDDAIARLDRKFAVLIGAFAVAQMLIGLVGYSYMQTIQQLHATDIDIQRQVADASHNARIDEDRLTAIEAWVRGKDKEAP